jgi:hypothetical protein
MRKTSLTILLASLLLGLPFHDIYSQDSIPADFCISDEEVKLYELINNYRKSINLVEIPLSKSLCYVAKKHVTDLHTNKPDTGTCNFHSWSDKGNWVACCFEKEIKDKSCMLNKPKELTSYGGSAYEIIYWENKQATADKSFRQWKETSVARSVISNYKNWEAYSWNAMGVAISEGFAIAWFGEEVDLETETNICGKNATIKNEPKTPPEETLIVSSATNRFYVIAGSYPTMDDAKEKLKSFQDEGFKKARIVVKDQKFRISISDYSTQELASQAKNQLPAKYKDAWILPY